MIIIGAGFLVGMHHSKQDSAAPSAESAEIQTTEETASPQETTAPEPQVDPEQEKRSLAAEHVYAHRGSSGDSAEHSFRQYDEAIGDGAAYIEQDIVISKDGTLYVSHDTDAGRMTGTNRNYSDMTDEEIDQLTTYAGEKILKLGEVFDRYGTSINYVIELKNTDRATEDAFASLVDQYGLRDRIIVQCFYTDTLEYLEGIFPEMPKLCLVKEANALEQGIEAPYVDIICVEQSMMTEETASRVHDSGKLFSAYTLVSEDEIRSAIDLGVDTYFTDSVALAISLEESYGLETRNRQTSGREVQE